MKNDNLKKEQQCAIHDVMLSAYIVILSHGEKIIVIASNIAEACDKLEKYGYTEYEFEHSCSFDVIP